MYSGIRFVYDEQRHNFTPAQPVLGTIKFSFDITKPVHDWRNWMGMTSEQVEKTHRLTGPNDIVISPLSNTVMLYKAFTSPVIIVLTGAFLAIFASVLFSPVINDGWLIAVMATMGGSLFVTIVIMLKNERRICDLPQIKVKRFKKSETAKIDKASKKLEGIHVEIMNQRFSGQRLSSLRPSLSRSTIEDDHDGASSTVCSSTGCSEQSVEAAAAELERNSQYWDVFRDGHWSNVHKNELVVGEKIEEQVSLRKKINFASKSQNYSKIHVIILYFLSRPKY